MASDVTDRMVEAAMSAWLKCPDFSSGTYNAMRAAIEAALKEQEQAEPVAWGWVPSDARDKWVIGAPQRKPLTEEEIESIWRQKPRWHAPPIGTTDIEFARAVEQAHGIGGEK